jgi:hypothetical protein
VADIIPFSGIDIVSIIDSAPEFFQYEEFKAKLSAGFMVFNSVYNLKFDVELIYGKIPRYIEPPNSFVLQIALDKIHMLQLSGAAHPFPKFKPVAREMTICEEKDGELISIGDAISQQCPTLEQLGGDEEWYRHLKGLYSLAHDDSVLHSDWFISASGIMQHAAEKANWKKHYNTWFEKHTGHPPEFYLKKSPALALDILKNYGRYQLEKNFY